MRFAFALAAVLAVIAPDTFAGAARGEYRSSITDIESGYETARRACSPKAGDAKAACLTQAANARSASRAKAGLRLKSADVGRQSGREIMAAHHEAIAAADIRDHAAARVRCDAMSATERAPCTALARASYRF